MNVLDNLVQQSHTHVTYWCNRGALALPFKNSVLSDLNIRT